MKFYVHHVSFQLVQLAWRSPGMGRAHEVRMIILQNLTFIMTQISRIDEKLHVSFS